MIFYGKKKQGKIVLYDSHTYDKYIDLLKEEADIQIDIRTKRKFRSIPQNRLYWAYLGAIEEYTGYTTEELHASFKAMFLTDSSKKLPLVRSTTMLNTEQFGIYLEKIRIYSLENISKDIVFPNPEDLYH